MRRFGVILIQDVPAGELLDRFRRSGGGRDVAGWRWALW